MCTLTYFKATDHIIITSNRDENIKRPSAVPPSRIFLKNTVVHCPLDPPINGTWILVRQDGVVYVLLNGAAAKHTPAPPYRQSRGIVLLEFADAPHPLDKWNSVNLKGIENFTIIVYIKNKLLQFRWNGIKKSHKYLNSDFPQIWSSSTLYDKDTIKMRSVWFEKFVQHKNGQINGDDLLKIHQSNNENGFSINRENMVLTKNITQVTLHLDRFTMRHIDLLKNRETFHESIIL